MSRRSDTWSAAGWALSGAAILVASWRMDRLGGRGINPWSAPGLTPGVVGALMLVLALVLALQARRSAADSDADGGSGSDSEGHNSVVESSLRPTLIAIALCVLFAGVTLGHGLPFVVAGAVFIALFNTVFGWPVWRAERRVARGLVMAVVVAVLASVCMAWLFESVFLVRLP